MKFESKFNHGDMVHAIHYKQLYKSVPNNCKACNSSGEITINDETFRCPKCYGNLKSEEDGIKWYVFASGKIGRIQITDYKKQDTHNKSGIEYMLDSTGIGSGTIYKEKDLFLDVNDAEKECEIRTKNQIKNI